MNRGEDINDTIDQVCEWASQQPPMSRTEFVLRLRRALVSLTYQQSLTEQQRDEIVQRMQAAPRGARGLRVYGHVDKIAQEFGVSREYCHRIVRQRAQRAEASWRAGRSTEPKAPRTHPTPHTRTAQRESRAPQASGRPRRAMAGGQQA